MSFVARVSSMLVGSNRMTPVRIGEKHALLLGPLTVEPAFRARGIGLALMEASIAAAETAGHDLVVPQMNVNEAVIAARTAVFGALTLRGVCQHIEKTEMLTRATPRDRFVVRDRAE